MIVSTISYKVSIRSPKLFKQFKEEHEALRFISRELDFRRGKRIGDNKLILEDGTEIIFRSIELLDKVIENIRRFK